MDYALQLSGELDCELDGGEVVHLTPGDVIVQRGTIYTWVNNGSVPAVIAFILVGAHTRQGKWQGNAHRLPCLAQEAVFIQWSSHVN
jgi:hypothetical protein